MKRKYSNKFADKEQQGAGSTTNSVRKNSKAFRRMTQMIAVATCINAFCGCGYISDGEKGGAES